MVIGSTPSSRSLAVDDEHLVGLRGQLVEAAQVTEHDFERDVRPHRDVLEVHQRADHVVVEGHRGAQLLALLDRQALEHIVHHLLRQVGRELGDLVGLQRPGRGDELLGVHRRDQRLADGVGDLEQNVAVARSADPVPDVETLVERAAPRGCRRCRPGAAGRARAAAPRRSSCRRRSRRARRGLRPAAVQLLEHQPFDQPVLAQQARYPGERLLHARVARRVVRCHPCLERFGHGRREVVARRRRVGRAHSNPGGTASGHVAEGIRASIVATRPSR